jgi:DNA invertase Pin-like site-specific DNA recombinase
LCADFAVGKGVQVVEEQFDDEGYSGASLDRPALQELLNQVRRGQSTQLRSSGSIGYPGGCRSAPAS